MTSRTTRALSSCAYLAPPTVSILPTRGKNGPCPRDARQPNLVVQRERFVVQSLAAANGDPEAMVVDEDFLVAMEQGFPPCGGMGMSIDRLLMALTGQGIRETITFPLVKRS